MRARAGERNKRISIERPYSNNSTMGREPAKDFDPYCRPWAKVLYGTGAERRDAGTQGASQAATFIVLDNSLTRLATVRDTVFFDNRRWNITSTAPIDGDIHITAVTDKG